jgi:hypothetical protein
LHKDLIETLREEPYKVNIPSKEIFEVKELVNKEKAKITNRKYGTYTVKIDYLLPAKLNAKLINKDNMETIFKCENCDSVVSLTDAFCANCGSQLQLMDGESRNFKTAGPPSMKDYSNYSGDIDILYYEGSYQISTQAFNGTLKEAKIVASKYLEKQYLYRKTEKDLWAEFIVKDPDTDKIVEASKHRIVYKKQK